LIIYITLNIKLIQLSTTHQIHSNIARANLGQFGRNEWGIVGFNCSSIQVLANHIKNEIRDFQIAYVDADHQTTNDSTTEQFPSFELTDKINYYQLNWKDDDLNLYKKRILLNEADLILVNGNHFEAKRQIICIDDDRLPSLKKRLTQFTNVQAFILKDANTTIPNFLKEKIEDWQKLPVFNLAEIEPIVQFVQDDLNNKLPPLNGLILAGGKSQRMGQDKGNIKYYDKPHRNYLAELIEPFCKDTYISTNESLAKSRFKTITDTFVKMGPMGAILSAFQYKPDVAWLVLACDYPLMNTATIQQLIDNRKPSKLATTFQSVVNEFPEPLITIYEPKSYAVLLQFLAQGYACPRKMLINSNINMLQANQPDIFINANHPSEMETAKQQIEHAK